jgi:hypothetical protein
VVDNGLFEFEDLLFLGRKVHMVLFRGQGQEFVLSRALFKAVVVLLDEVELALARMPEVSDVRRPFYLIGTRVYLSV